MKISWALLMLLIAGALTACSLNEQTFPLVEDAVREDAVFEQLVPTLVDQMTLSLDGQLPNRNGMVFEYDPPQTLLRPSKLTLNLKTRALLDVVCASLTTGRIRVQAYLGPPPTLWDNPLGEEIDWDLTGATPLTLDLSSELNDQQRDAVLNGKVGLGFAIRSDPDLTIAPNRSGSSCTTQGADGSDYTRVQFRFSYKVEELSMTAQIF